MHGYHVPAVCYADDLMLISTNVADLRKLLGIVENFADFWRLEFVHPQPARTKSHCIVFGADLLSSIPAWHLSGQQLAVRAVTEHLGVVLSADLSGSHHVRHRATRARGAFYGLTPAGILSNCLAPMDKAFLWKTVITPALTFGCEVSCLRAADIDILECLQSRCIKAALGLSKYAHHSALLVALGIPRVHERLGRAVLFALTRMFACRHHHRLRHILTGQLAILATEPRQLSGSFLDLAYRLLNCSFRNVLDAVRGHADMSAVSGPIASDGIVDSLRFLLHGDQSTMSQKLVRLLCS